MKKPATILAVGNLASQAFADEPAPAPAIPSPAVMKFSVGEPATRTFEHRPALSPKAAGGAGGEHRWKKFTGVVSHFPLLIWDDVRPPDEILRYGGISSRPWTQIVGWHPCTIFNEDCAVHEPSCAIFTSSQ